MKGSTRSSPDPRTGPETAAAACIGSAVDIGTGSFIGLNATIREGVTIGDYAFVGMAVVPGLILLLARLRCDWYEGPDLCRETKAIQRL